MQKTAHRQISTYLDIPIKYYEKMRQNDPELLAFLRGEEISTIKRGYPAVCVNGVPLGFGKASQGRLKNHYPKGLRNNSQ